MKLCKLSLPCVIRNTTVFMYISVTTGPANSFTVHPCFAVQISFNNQICPVNTECKLVFPVVCSLGLLCSSEIISSQLSRQRFNAAHASTSIDFPDGTRNVLKLKVRGRQRGTAGLCNTRCWWVYILYNRLSHIEILRRHSSKKKETTKNSVFVGLFWVLESSFFVLRLTCEDKILVG